MRIYIAGPMRGYAEFNFPAFDEAAARGRALGHDIISPAEVDRIEDEFNPITGENHKEQTHYVTRDVGILVSLAPDGAIALLPGWENSTGAVAERAVAKWLGLKILDARTFEAFEAPNVKAKMDPEGFAALRARLQRKRLEGMDAHSSHQPSPYSEPAIKLFVPERPSPLEQAFNEHHEVRITDALTGGQKGSKLARFDLVPAHFMNEFAELYGRGARKYAERNWEKGYSWGLAVAALQRHLNAWLRGKKRDEDGNHHLAQVAWHAASLFTFEKFGLGTDDRSQLGREEKTAA